MADQFKPGDVVALKSGGPLMTVVKYGEYNGERKVSCEWFDSKEVKQHAVFADVQLRVGKAD